MRIQMTPRLVEQVLQKLQTISNLAPAGVCVNVISVTDACSFLCWGHAAVLLNMHIKEPKAAKSKFTVFFRPGPLVLTEKHNLTLAEYEQDKATFTFVLSHCC